MKKIVLPTIILGLLVLSFQYVKSKPSKSLSGYKGFLEGIGGIDRSNSQDKIIRFITEMYDARLMDIQEGLLAKERGTSEAIRQYGELMINEQATLKTRLEDLARAKGVILPNSLSSKKAKGLENLKKFEGKKFDRKFKKMITIDHKRDIRKFKKALHIEDIDLSTFAKQNLPLIEEHLRKIKEIK